MGLAYSSEEKKNEKNYVTPQDKENVLVGSLMSRTNGYKIAIGYRKAKTRAPRKLNVYGKKPKRTFVPTQCKFCGAEVSYGSISKSRLRAAGSTWIDTCDSCAVTPDVAQEVKIYV
ncbi:MAG: hypothetical protein HYT71_00650 [Candidatus Aenigmarchaeota archaeon]|nr:hypothetical protein [Candidatus Aenigmarchaeota archaeon]